jgi:DNA-binding NarL/FixJ family response regulator
VSDITVFLADDHAVLRDSLRFTLEAQPDIKVVGSAADGREALRRVRSLCPDVVLMDIAMPEMNGIEATQYIVETCPQTRVVILSMYRTLEHVTRALQAGAWGYLLKESLIDEVIEAVRAVHAGHHYLSQEISDQIIEHYAGRREPGAGTDPLAGLSLREREVLQLVVEGKTTAEIADRLSLSPKTVKSYRSRVMKKLGIGDLPALVRFAIRRGLISLD